MAVCADKRLRVFRFATGKMRRVYDESLEVCEREEWRVGALVCCALHSVYCVRYALQLPIASLAAGV